MIERALTALEAAGDRELFHAPAGRTGAGDGRRLSGRALLGRIGGWQRTLREHGVAPGDRVAIDLGRRPDLACAHLAVLAAGACAVPLNPALAPAERSRVLERAAARCLLDGEQHPEGEAQPHLARCDDAAPALLIFTSGTTGEPKGVPLSLANLEANLAGLAETWGLSSDDQLLHVLPAHHVHGLVLGLYGSLRLGLPVVMLDRFAADDCLRALDQHAITVFMGVPTMYHRMLRAECDASLASLRVCISGSAPLAPADFHGFRERFGHEPLERYGLSETLIVSSNPLDGKRRPGSVGRPLPDTEVRLADDGEIEVSSPAVMAGYWHDEAASEAAFHDGFFRTGDLGRHDEAGYLVIAGRKKELIIVGGSNVLPGEVESALAPVAGVDELAAAGLADPDRGEVVAAFVVAGRDVDPDELETRLRERAEAELAPYKRPRHYRFVTELARNAMGKVDRKRLK